ncbi:MAG: beta-lactamase family protein [Bacteroidia bacterium]|nr:beta-lactamase family protein [Bacteroidia bacterium]
MRRKIIVSTILGLLLHTGTIAQGLVEKSQEQTSIEGKIADILTKNGVKGAAYCAVSKTDVLLANGLGWADQLCEIPVNEQVVFRLGSISKVFTALAILQLHEKNLLSLRDTVSVFFENADFPFTVADLLSHHSGLPSDYLSGFYTQTPLGYQEIWKVLNQMPLSHLPRTSLSYSNLGYDLLGLIIERKSGISYEEYIRINIFQPLGMKSSFFSTPPHEAIMISEGFKANGEVFSEPPMRDLPAIMLHSNLKDMTSFIQHLLRLDDADTKGGIIQLETYQEMLRVQNEDIVLDFDRKMGLGFFLYEKFSQWEFMGRAIGHGGDTYLFHSQMTLFPGHDFGVLVMTNSEMGQRACEEIEWELVNDYASKELGLGYHRRFKWSHGRMRGELQPVSNFEGTYALGTEIFHFKAKNGRLTYKNDEGKGRLVPDGKDGLFVNYGGGTKGRGGRQGAIFFQEINGNKVITGIGKQGEVLLGVEENINPIPKNWKGFLGNYQASEDLDEFFLSNISLEMEEGFLILKASVFGRKHKQSLGINPLNDVQGVILGLGRNSGDLIEIFEKDGEKFLHYSGLSWKKR